MFISIFGSVRTQAAQTHYMNADVTLACGRCCVTNGYLQRLVWDRSVFLKRDKNAENASKRPETRANNKEYNKTIR